jgi:hypothetical protein
VYRKPPIFFLNTELTLRLLYTYITNFIVHVIWSSIYKSNLCSFEGLNFGRRNALGKHTHFLQQSLSIGDFFMCNNFILFLCITYRRRKCCYDSCTALSDHGCGCTIGGWWWMVDHIMIMKMVVHHHQYIGPIPAANFRPGNHSSTSLYVHERIWYSRK